MDKAMLGEAVEVLRRTQSGTDIMGEPVYTWGAETVDNCLVRPLTGSDLNDAMRPDGVRVRYNVAFPKTYEGRATLRGCKVSLRGCEPLFVVGEPDITNPCPTMWDVVAEVGRVDG